MAATAHGLATPAEPKALSWLRALYRQNAVWQTSTATAASIDRLKDSQGAYIWRETMIAGQPPLLLGYPVEFNETCPTSPPARCRSSSAISSSPISIVDKAGIRWLRDPYSQKPWSLVYAYRRTGGAPANSEAVKLMTVAAS